MFEKLCIEVEIFKNMLISKATGTEISHQEYKDRREQLLKSNYIKDKMPRFIKTCRSSDEFWSYIKEKSQSYEGRRKYLREQFDPVLTYLEQNIHVDSPVDEVVTSTVSEKISNLYIQTAWQKALERRTTDPEGAITMARTLIEATCKHILDEANHSYDDKAELPALYKEVQVVLNLAPNAHTEQIFKQILGGCSSVITGLGSLRNKLSDAHGKSQKTPKPSPRHAKMAVNLGGTMAEFLLSSWEEASVN